MDDHPVTEEGGHETFSWVERAPSWAAHLIRLSEKILRNQGVQMTQAADLKTQFTTALANLKDAITTALKDLQSKSSSSGLTDADWQGVIDQLNTEHDTVVAAVQAADNPPAPVTPPTPAGP